MADEPDVRGGRAGLEAPPPARRGIGVVGRTVLFSVALVAAFVVGLAGVALFGGSDRVGGTGDEDATDDATIAGPDAGPDAGDAPDTLPSGELEPFGDADPVDVEAYRGQPLLVNFWATWCPPCVEEMPDLQQVHEQVGDRVAFLGINVRDAPRNAEAFVDELGITYDLAADPDAGYYERVGGYGMPTTLLVDPDGTIVARHVGELTAAELREALGEHFDVDFP